MSEKTIYRLDDNISFRTCSLFNISNQTVFGDCTTPFVMEKNYIKYYTCRNNGIHLHCTRHPEVELEIRFNKTAFPKREVLCCPRCNNQISFENIEDIRTKCLRLLNIPLLKDAKLIRLDDWYTPELKEKIKSLPSQYWMMVNIKEDKEGNSIVVIYIGNRDKEKKAQIFIKPERGQLSHDHKDLDPSTLISKIEVTLKDKKLTQEFGEQHINYDIDRIIE